MSLVKLPLSVVKIGGSLFDHPRLGPGLREWIANQKERRFLFVPGGGALADVVRAYQLTHGLSADTCHWLAIQTMTVNARLIRSFLPDCCEVNHPLNSFNSARTAILDAFAFSRSDDGDANALPHGWEVTSDSIAARAAEVGKAQQLVLLKSTDLPIGIDWFEAARLGLVDPIFHEIVKRAEISVEWVNLRANSEPRP